MTTRTYDKKDYSETVTPGTFARSLKGGSYKVLIVYNQPGEYKCDLTIRVVDNETLALLNVHNGRTVNQSDITSSEQDQLVSLIEGLNLGNEDIITEVIDVTKHNIQYIFSLGWAN